MEPLIFEELKKTVEALLFVAEEPLSSEALAEYTQAEQSAVMAVLEAIGEEYRDRGFNLVEIAGGWQFMTAPQLHSYVERLYQPKMHRLSRAAMETLAIIAYCQPITRGEIEEIRGVNADGIVSGLLEKGLLEEVGRKDTPGKPVLYSTNGRFLELLGLTSLAELPAIDKEAFAKQPNLFDQEEDGLFDEISAIPEEGSSGGIENTEV